MKGSFHGVFVACATVAVAASAHAQSAGNRLLGIDVSAWQGGISQTTWNSIRSVENRQFVFVRSSRGGTTGIDKRQGGFPSNDDTFFNLSQRYDDPYFVQNVNRATAAGMFVGSYHFARPDIITTTSNSGGIANSGTDEANHYIQMAGAFMRPGYLVPTFDLEAGEGLRTDNELTQFSIDFSNRIYEVMRIRPMIYINGNYASAVLGGASATLRDQLAKPAAVSPSLVSPAYSQLWTARYTNQSNPDAINVQTGNPSDGLATVYGPFDDYGDSQPWTFWQYASTGRLASFNSGNSNLDFNVVQGGVEFLKDQLVPAVWWNDTSGDWSTLANWNSGQAVTVPVSGTGQVAPIGTQTMPVPRLPGASGTAPTSGWNDTVILERPNADITVTLSTGTHAIRKFYVRENFAMTGGSLTANYVPVAESTPASIQISASTSVSGGASLSAHTIAVDAARRLTAGNANLTFNTLTLARGGTAAALWLNGDVTITGTAGGTATIATSSGTAATGLIDLAGGARTITVTNGTAAVDLQVAVPLGNGGLVKAGAGTMQLAAANPYTGTTSILGGVLALGTSATISSSPLISVGSGATFDVSQKSGGLTIASGQTLGGSGTVLGSITFGRGSTLSPGAVSTVSGAALLSAGGAMAPPETIAVPEPASWSLIATACGLLGLRRLRRRKAIPVLMAAAGLLLVAAGSASAAPSVRTIANESMNIDTAGVVVTASSSSWRITAPMRADNGDTSLPSSFRRWWHFEVGGLDSAGSTLAMSLTKSGYSDLITPVWSLDGGLTYQRVPGAVPAYSSSTQTHSFTVKTPPGVSSIRIAKYFPYTLGMYDRFRATLAGNPFVREETIGQSAQGRGIVMHTVTDATASDAGKQRVWVHAAVHPSETPASFTAEGLLGWLTGGSDEARTLLGKTIFNVVTMANPDGVALGNYRTTSSSVNLEVQWASPYTSTVPEIVALRSTIERFMGPAAAPGSNPITMLLNLHGSHGETYPFHFVHRASYPTSGVTAEVRALEDRWVAAFKGRSQFGALRTTDPESTLSGRGYVESMMHDRYTIAPTWDPVMAITFEGTYQAGPTAGVPNTPDDYRRLGSDMGWAVADYYGVSLAPTTLFAGSGTTLGQAAAGQPLLAGTLPARKTGAGTFVLDVANTISGSTTVQQGTLRLAHPAALASSTISPLAGGTLAVAAGLQTTVGSLKPLAGGLVDVGTGLVTVARGLSPADLRAALAAGRADGSWSGTSGITSSAAASARAQGTSRSVGWLDDGAGSLTIAFAAPGDANLDWVVDVLDVAAISGRNAFGTDLAATWADGDFNDDGIVDVLDVADAVAEGLFNAGAYNGPTGGIAAVPEPETMRLLTTSASVAVIASLRNSCGSHVRRRTPCRVGTG
ncbi:MAG: autotransporter-associated beta strand repeat-containing protein [Planctomycetota bacterium]